MNFEEDLFDSILSLPKLKSLILCINKESA